MKKKIFTTMFSVALGATLFVSCQAEDEVPQMETQSLEEIEIKLAKLGFNTETLHETTMAGESGYAVDHSILNYKNQVFGEAIREGGLFYSCCVDP